MFKTVLLQSYCFLIFLFIAGSILSCNQRQEAEEAPEKDTNAEQINIHLPAMYTGTLPCADCPGIDYRLIIEENRFVEINHYRDRTPGRFEETGNWTVSGDTLSLLKPDNQNPRKRFLLSKEKLTMLDMQNQEVTGDLADMYVLERVGSQKSIRKHHQKMAERGYLFYAAGNEPFWSLRLDSMNHLFYKTPLDSTLFEAKDLSYSGRQTTLRASSDLGRITVDTIDRYCQDSMSGYLFPLEVKVYLNTSVRDTLNGCGLYLNR